MRARRRDLPAVIALSGLDGSGKSTQARALADRLSALGYDVVVVWNRLTFNPSLLWATAPLRLALRVAVRLGLMREPPLQVQADGDPIPREHLATRAVRERLPFVSKPWVAFVALVHAVGVRRSTLRELRRGRVVVHDRYVLDAFVQLHDRYAATHGVGGQAWLIRRLVPPPLAAYLLDITAEEAHRRKPEEFSVAELDAHRRHYLQEAERSGVRVLDARRPPDDLATLIAGEVVEALHTTPPRPVRRRGPWPRTAPRGASGGGGPPATQAFSRTPFGAAGAPRPVPPRAMG